MGEDLPHDGSHPRELQELSALRASHDTEGPGIQQISGSSQGANVLFLTSDLLVLLDLTGPDGQASQEEGQEEDKTRDKGRK